MVRNRRSAFLDSLKSRLDRDLVARERSDAPAPPRWQAVQPPVEDEDWPSAAGERPGRSPAGVSDEWGGSPTGSVEIDPWVPAAQEWPPPSDDEAEVRGQSQWTPADDFPWGPAPDERPARSNAAAMRGDGQRWRSLVEADLSASAASEGSWKDRAARHGEALNTASEAEGGGAWTAPLREVPLASDDDAAPDGDEHPAATAGDDPFGNARTEHDPGWARDDLDAPPAPMVVPSDAAAGERPDEPDPGVAWSESGMSHRLREAIASVRRISIGRSPDADDQPAEALGEASEQSTPQEEAPTPLAGSEEAEAPDELASWRPAARAPVVAAGERRGLRVAALVIASAVVLLVGSGLGVLLAGWQLELPSLPVATAPSEAPTPPPAAETPAPITEVVRLQPAPLPPAAVEGPQAATSALPLPPPPKPAPWSTAAGDGPPAVEDAIDALLRESEGAAGSPQAAAAPTTAAGAPRVFVHYTASAGGPATAMHLVRQLEAAGFTAAARQVEIPIAAPSVRYFFAADRDEAEAVGSSLKGQMPGGSSPPVLDFTDFEPKPPPGELEVWINS